MRFTADLFFARVWQVIEKIGIMKSVARHLVRPTGIEPVLRASEARILSVGRRSLGYWLGNVPCKERLLKNLKAG